MENIKELQQCDADADSDAIDALDGVNFETNLVASAALLGVHPGPAGLPAAAPAKDPLRAPSPARHLLRAYLQAAGECRFQRIWSILEPPDRTRLLSCGGLVSGQSLLAPPTTDEVEFDDADYWTLPHA